MKRNILLNPGPATTTDSVKQAQVIPDICPREKEFTQIMHQIRKDLVKIVHGDPATYTAVLFCGSGTIGMDICLNSLLPADKKILIINNGAYSARGVEICENYRLPYMQLQYREDELPNLSELETLLSENEDIALVYTTHHETGTGLLNPVGEIGDIVHKYNGTFVVDTTSSYAMIPIDIEKENIDFCMASAQKGLMAMTGLSFVIGRKKIIELSKDYPRRSYYCNLFLQHDVFEQTGEMHFTPPVQTVYATRQALFEYFEEGEAAKWERHKAAFRVLENGMEALGFSRVIGHLDHSNLVLALKYPDHPAWDFEKIHDYCYKRGYTIYPGKISGQKTFRLCTLGAIDGEDIKEFLVTFALALEDIGIKIPVQ